MTLVFSPYHPQDPDTQRRHAAAYATWQASGMRLLPFTAGQTSREINDPYDVPFVKDMIDAGLDKGWGEDALNIAVLCNNDIEFEPILPDAIRDSCTAHGCYWAYRKDRKGSTDGGVDLIAVTRWWWQLNCVHYPDFLFALRGWDSAMRELMEMTGCPEGVRAYIHEPHPHNDSKKRLGPPGSVYNEHLWERWGKEKHALV